MADKPFKRESMNPVTISGKKDAGATAPPAHASLERHVTVGRVGVPAQAKDGQQRITAERSEDRLITVMMWDGKKTGGTADVKNVLVIDEETFINAMCLLFPDRLCRAEEVPFAELIGLLKTNRPKDFADLMGRAGKKED